MLANAGKDPRAAFAGAVPFLKLMGIVAGGWQMARAALACEKRLAEGTGDAELDALRTAVGFELACARKDDREALAQWAALDQGILPGPYLERLLPLHRQRALRARP